MRRIRKRSNDTPRLKRRAILLTVLLTGISFLFGALAGGTPANAIPVASWPSQVAHPASTACAEGEKLITPTSGTTDDLGVSHIVYAAAPGLVVNLPPRGLSAAKVTPAMLSDLGHATGAKMTADMRRSLVQQTVALSTRPTAPAFCQSPVRTSSGFRPAAENMPSGVQFAHTWSGNWGGYAVTQAENGGAGINSVYGAFVVGSNMTPDAEQPGAEATWVGIGGNVGGETNGWGLIQAGVSMIYQQGYQTWREYIGTGCPSSQTDHRCDPIFNASAARPGDSVVVQVWWNSSTQACFELTDYTHTGASIPSVCQDNPPILYDHTSAEWVNENLLTSYPYYDNPGTINWTNQRFSDSFGAGGTWMSPFSGAYEAIIMTYANTSATTCGTGNGVLGYPANPGGTSTSGTSSIITCSVPGIDAN